MKDFTLKPVVGEQFVGREDVVSKLVSLLGDRSSPTGFCIYGPRRIGKTSLLKEVKFKLSEKRKIVVAYLSFYEFSELSQQVFAEELSAAIIDAFRQEGLLPISYSLKTLLESPREVIEKALESVSIGVELTRDLRVFIELKKQKQGDYAHLVEKALCFGEKLAEKTGSRLVLMLDEFPEVLKIENGLQLVKMIRTVSEDQKRTSLMISGSIQKTMEAVALSEASPFYKQLIPIKLKPFSIAEVKQFLKKYGAESKVDAQALFDVTGGLPFYMQWIGKSYGFKSIRENVEKFIGEEGDVFFLEELGKLSEKEQLIVASMAKNNHTPTQIAEMTEEPITAVMTYLKRLEEKGVVEKKSRGVYALSDPVFLLWLKKKYA